MTDWATAQDVFNITGVTVEDAAVQRAQYIIEMFADVSSEGASPQMVSTKNLRYLRFATAYQTAWMREHPDVFSNVDVTNVSEDGLSFTNAHANSGVLAPLAKRSIDRLTWRRPNRSIRIGKKLDPAFMYQYGTRDSAVADDSRDWTSM
jgi:hypothetical protein